MDLFSFQYCILQGHYLEDLNQQELQTKEIIMPSQNTSAACSQSYNLEEQA